MMNENIVKKRAYRALIKSGKYEVQELRKEGFKFSSGYGSIFHQIEGFCMAKYEYANDI